MFVKKFPIYEFFKGVEAEILVPMDRLTHYMFQLE